MTVEEYYVRFMQLARFTVDLGVSEAFLIVKFNKNLNQNICDCIGTQKFQYMIDILIATQEAEALEPEENPRNFRDNSRTNDRRVTRRNQRQWMMPTS